MADDVLDKIIGKPTGTTVVTVERGQLGLFAQAVKDESAGEIRWLLYWPEAPAGNPMAEVLGPLMAKGGIILHGEQEFTYHRPVLAGDVLVGEGKVVDAYQKESKGKTMTFVVVETAWSERGTGEPVCTSRINIIHRI